MTALVNVLAAFSERHFDRIQRFIKGSFELNFFLKKASVMLN